MAEECFFRGYIQQALASRGKWFAVLAGAILFGLQHWQGGPLYIGFATIAGIAYGLVYWRSRKIAFPILIHFLFNLIHFLFFTYPALAK
jgi:membrane protease YdiL (CAAX protease family)